MSDKVIRVRVELLEGELPVPAGEFLISITEQFITIRRGPDEEPTYWTFNAHRHNPFDGEQVSFKEVQKDFHLSTAVEGWPDWMNFFFPPEKK